MRNRKEKALVLSCACRGWSVWNFPPGGSQRPPGDQINRRWSLTDKEHRCSVALVLLPPLSPAAPHCTFIPDRTRLAGRGEEAQITLCIWKCGTFKVSSLIGRKVGVGSWWTQSFLNSLHTFTFTKRFAFCNFFLWARHQRYQVTRCDCTFCLCTDCSFLSTLMFLTSPAHLDMQVFY